MCPIIGADTHHFDYFMLLSPLPSARLHYHFHRLRCHPIALLYLLHQPSRPPLRLYWSSISSLVAVGGGRRRSGSVALMSPYDLHLLLGMEAGSVWAKCHIFIRQFAGVLVMI